MPYNNSFIDQACLVKIAGYCSSSLYVFMDLDYITVHKHARKELGQYLAILTSLLVNNPYGLYKHDKNNLLYRPHGKKKIVAYFLLYCQQFREIERKILESFDDTEVDVVCNLFITLIFWEDRK